MYFIVLQVLWQVDSILFCLLVLHALCDSQGRVWRAHPCHLYTVEVTLPKVIWSCVLTHFFALLLFFFRHVTGSRREGSKVYPFFTQTFALY